MEKVLFLGVNGLVGRSFKALYGGAYEFFGLDKDDIGGLEKLIERQKSFKAVIFAAQSPDYKSSRFTSNLFEVNVHLLLSTLTATSEATRKFIYFSSGSVYVPSTGALTEESRLNILSGNPYVASKLMGEEIVSSFKEDFEELTVLRPFFIYGPGQNKSMLVESIRSKISNGDLITLAGGKGLDFNPVYVDDVARMLQAIIVKEGPGGIQRLNVFGNEPTTLAEIVRILEKRMAKKANVAETNDNPGNWIADTITDFRLGTTTISEGLASY
jgi:UDP-glucose 4-epimerase